MIVYSRGCFDLGFRIPLLKRVSLTSPLSVTSTRDFVNTTVRQDKASLSQKSVTSTKKWVELAYFKCRFFGGLMLFLTNRRFFDEKRFFWQTDASWRSDLFFAKVTLFFDKVTLFWRNDAFLGSKRVNFGE